MGGALLTTNSHGTALNMKTPQLANTAIKRPFGESLKFFLKNEQGATAIEYGLIASVISIAIVASVTDIGSKVAAKFSNIETLL